MEPIPQKSILDDRNVNGLPFYSPNKCEAPNEGPRLEDFGMEAIPVLRFPLSAVGFNDAIRSHTQAFGGFYPSQLWATQEEQSWVLN